MKVLPEFAARGVAELTPSPKMAIWEWAEKNCDFSRATNYDCAGLVGPYDSSVAPYTKGILDWCQDSSIREIVVRKCSRAGVSESLLMFIRWIVAERPGPTYYLTADQLLAERFMESRIKRGWRVCKKTHEKFKQAQSTMHDIRFDHMDFRVSWPNAKGAFKQDGWQTIIADEFATWKHHSPDMLRKRAGTYRFHTIVMLSSPDPTRKGASDPVIDEYESTDQNLWHMPDPKTGNDFTWQFGGTGKSHGLKWPSDAQDPETKEWDLERVRNEAYYLTEDGTRIENKERQGITAKGAWVATREGAPKHVRGCWIVGPMVPFLDGDFGVLAYRFLEAKRKGSSALRSYFFENWADVGHMPNSVDTRDGSMRAREINYSRSRPFYDSPDVKISEQASKGLSLTVDVQKSHLWYVARDWTNHGASTDTGLREWGKVANFDDLYTLCEKLQPNVVGIDAHYQGRYGETVDFCASEGALALMGEENMKKDIYLRDDMDPSEGRKSRMRLGSRFSMLTWNTDIFRSKLLSAIDGDGPFPWHVYRMIERQYVRQVLSTHKVDGEWIRKKGHPDDHLFDCEVMQLVLARFGTLIQ